MTVASVSAAAGGTGAARGLQSFRAGDRVDAERRQIVGQQDRSGLTEPRTPALRLSVSNGITSTRPLVSAATAIGISSRIAGSTPARAHRDVIVYLPPRAETAVLDGDLQDARVLAGAPARDDVGRGADVEHDEDAGKGGGVEAAERMRDSLANRAENRRAQIHLGVAAFEPRDGAAALISLADQPPAQPHEQSASQPGRRHPDHRPARRRHRLHRPLRRVFAGAGRDHLVGVAFLAKKAEHRVERREADGSLAQPLGVEPVFVERQSRRQNVGDALMKARHQHPPYSGFAHIYGKIPT
jgi:hypothetical protein